MVSPVDPHRPEGSLRPAPEQVRLEVPEQLLCEALLDLACEHGYSAVTVAAVVERAGVGREQFSAHFPSLESCALALFDRIEESFEDRVGAAFAGEPRWPDSLRAASYAVAGWIEDNPSEVRFAAVEMLWVSELAQARREAGFQQFWTMIDAGRGEAADPDSVPASAAESVIGSIAGLLTRRLQDGTLKPYDLVPELMSLAVRPYLGEEAAGRELRTPPPHPG